MKTTKTKKFMPEYGWIEQVRFYLFGFHVWTENHPLEIPEDVEPMAIYQLKRERQVSYSEMSANMPELTNAEFDKFQKQLLQDGK